MTKDGSKKYNVTMEKEKEGVVPNIYFYADVYLLQNLWMDFIILQAQIAFCGAR